MISLSLPRGMPRRSRMMASRRRGKLSRCTVRRSRTVLPQRM